MNPNTPQIAELLDGRLRVSQDRQTEESCKFLKLPLEIRLHIYSFLLPYARFPSPIQPGPNFWYRGQTALLAVSRQVHAETAGVMYGDSLFIVEIEFDKITFRHRLMLRNGMTSPMAPPFLDTVRGSNLKRVRYIAINVRHVDSYTGTIKYNFGGDGLTEGLRNQVQTVVDALSTIVELRSVQVRASGGNRDVNAARRVLEPFAQLCNIDGEVAVYGSATESFRHQLECAMKDRGSTAMVSMSFAGT